VARTQQALNITLREYNVSHGFALVDADPSRVAATRLRGRNLEKGLASGSEFRYVYVGIPYAGREAEV
jgi:hypothetical protein